MSKEYIEKEAAIRNICKGCSLFDTDNCICTGSIRCDECDAILDTPPADVKPVVLCKDCKHSYEDIGGLTCSHGVCVDSIVADNFYCADGERRR